MEWIIGLVIVLGGIGFLANYKPKPKFPTPADISNAHGDAAYLDLEGCKQQGLLSGAGIPLGRFAEQRGSDWVYHPLHYAGEKHLVTIAPTRTGKGTTAQLPALLEHDASIFMIDPKGENAAIAARFRRDAMKQAVFIVNPFQALQKDFDARGFPKSARFNPLASLDAASDTFMAEVAALCEALILSEGKEPHWTDSARDLVAARILWVCKYGKPEDRTLPAVRDFLTLDPDSFLAAVAAMAACDDVLIRNKATRFIKSRQELDSIISTAQTQTAFLDDPCLRESLSGDDFRFIDLKRRKMTVFLVLPAKLIPAYAKWFRLLVVAALDALMSTEEKADKPVLLMLDEFASLGHLSSVENAMGLAAGFGVQLWPFVQDIHQLEDVYSRRWKSFLANAGVQQYFTPNDWDTAESVSKRAGSQTIRVQGVSTTFSGADNAQGMTGSASYSYNETGKPLIDTGHVLGLPSHAGIIFLSGCQNPLLCNRLDYRQNEKYNGLWDENPYFARKRAAPSPVAPATATAAAQPAPALVGSWGTASRTPHQS